MAHRLEIYKDTVRGFCCRTQEDYAIRRGWLLEASPSPFPFTSFLFISGTYVCDFVGEILPDYDHQLRDLAIIGEYSMNVPTVSRLLVSPVYSTMTRCHFR